MATKKTSPEKTVSKTAYIKALPPSMPAKEVVDKAKADGMKLTVQYVYSIRQKAKAGDAPKKRGRTFGSKAGKATGGKGAEGALYNVISQIVEETVNRVLGEKFGALLK